MRIHLSLNSVHFNYLNAIYVVNCSVLVSDSLHWCFFIMMNTIKYRPQSIITRANPGWVSVFIHWPKEILKSLFSGIVDLITVFTSLGPMSKQHCCFAFKWRMGFALCDCEC